MDERSPEPTGDYGYDLVHEESLEESEPRRSAAPPNPAPGHPGPPPEEPDEFDGDYGYDEAHDL